ncbi:unnamed protein product [Prorocentrum cordatum]|uniref:Uncharacterized protein n=1 Tax=Prorocentrum cordatum TaxID=2364126 RepID=A0ABN9T8L5_9DINO|nr:unnamed protein product [Polarella glacialis]
MVLGGRELAREERRQRRLPAFLGAHFGEIRPAWWIGTATSAAWTSECWWLPSAARWGKRPLVVAPRLPKAFGGEAAHRPALGPPPLVDADVARLVAEVQAGGGYQLGDEVAPGP